MTTPTALTPEQLQIAQTYETGQLLIPSREMIHKYKVTVDRLTIAKVNREAGHSQSDLSFQVTGQSSLAFQTFDGAWFVFPVLLDPRFIDPAVLSLTK